MSALLLLFAMAPQVAMDFRAANEAALEGNLDEAIGLYESVLERGVEDADVYFNLGNALARSGRELDAIVTYEMALRLAPGDADISANLWFVRSQVSSAEATDSALTLADAVEPVIGPIDPEVSGWILCGANTLLFLLWWIRRRWSVRTLTVAVGIAALVVVIMGAVVAGHYVIQSEERGVLVDAADLKEGPHERFNSKGPAALGGRVRVLDHAEGFLRVLQQDGTTGWVDERAVTRV